MTTKIQSSAPKPADPSARQAFEQLLPVIERMAAYHFRCARGWRRAELICDVVATAFATFVRLIELGKGALAYPALLARCAIRTVLSGRSLAVSEGVRDVLSPLAQRRKNFQVAWLGDTRSQRNWEQLTTSRAADPSEIAACRIDFRSWLGQLQDWKRQVALALANGATTNEVACQFAVTPGRISQLRRELAAGWSAFQALPV